MAQDNIKSAQKKQKQQYDKRSVESMLRVGDRVMVYFPRVVQGKAWKFARPYNGPYTVISLTPTNAEVRLLSCPEGDTIFVALDRIRPCYAEMSDEVWTGHGYRGPSPKKTVKRRLSKVKNCDITH